MPKKTNPDITRETFAKVFSGNHEGCSIFKKGEICWVWGIPEKNSICYNCPHLRIRPASKQDEYDRERGVYRVEDFYPAKKEYPKKKKYQERSDVKGSKPITPQRFGRDDGHISIESRREHHAGRR